MANIYREITYYCRDDCEWSGCPGHVGVLHYQSTGDGYSFNLGGQILQLNRGKMEAMISLLRSLDRVDCIQVK